MSTFKAQNIKFILSNTYAKDIFITKMIYILGFIVFRMILDYAFCKYISSLYAYYMQLKYEPSSSKLFISYIFMIFLLMITEFDKSKLESVIMSEELLIMVIPMFTLYAHSGKNQKFMFLVSAAYIFQIVFIKFYKQLRKNNRSFKIYNPNKWIVLIISSILVISFIYSISHFSFSFAALDFEHIYEIRSNTSLSFPFSYLLPWAFKICVVFLILLGLYSHRKLLWGSGIALQLYFFFVLGNKSTFFSLLLLIASYIAIKKMDIIKIFGWGLAIVAALSIFLYEGANSITLLSYLVRRALLVPARIKFAYYEYYSVHSKLYFAGNTIGKILGKHLSYLESPPKAIAEYLGVPDSYCNSGYFGDAYANFGAVGVFIFALVFIWFVLLISYKAESMPYEVVCPFLIVLVYGLNDGALFTWLLGGGGLLAYLLLCLYRKSSKKKGTFNEKNMSFNKCS